MNEREYQLKLGRYLRGVREEQGKSQSYVAERVGLSRPAYSLIELGGRCITVFELALIALALNRSVAYIVRLTLMQSERVALPVVNHQP